MASSGWLGEQFIVQRSSSISYYGNVYISSVSRSNTSVTISGTIRFLAKGTSGVGSYYNYGVQADPDGSSDWVTLLGNNENLKNGNYKDVSFNTTINVASSATSVSMGVRFCAWYNSTHTRTYWDVTKSWTISFDPGTQAPSGLSAQFISCTDTTVTLDVDVGNYGTPASASGRYVEGAVLGSSSYGAPYRYAQASNTSSARLTITNSNSGALTITPNTEYHYGVYANNTSASSSAVASDTFITLPAYITNVNAVHTGGGVVNISVAHAAEGSALTVYTEYSWDGETWTIASDTFNVTVSSRRPIYIRRSSDAGETPTYTLSIAPNNGPQIYGSVSGLSKNLSPLYASFGNYFDGHRYLARTDRSVEISGDDVTITKVSSGSGGWQWVAFPIDATDEIINKQVTITGEMYTSSPENSMIALYWLNTAGTNYVSQVSGFQFTGHADKFTITGTIPSRPSNAGNLCIMLYSNKESQPQGTYTIFRNVELKANVKNMFNYTTVSASYGGLTNTLADDGTITTTGVPTANYTKIIPFTNITNLLEDGCWYTMRKDIDITGGVTYFEVRRKSTGGAYTYCATNSVRKSAAFKVDKTNFTEYGIYYQTDTTSVWGTSSRTITSRHQLEKGIDMSGENLINPFALGSGSTSSVNYSVASDGKITISGTASAACHVQIPFTLDSSLVGSSISIILDGKLNGFSNFGLKNNTSNVSGLGTMNAAVPAVTTNAITSAMVSSVTCFDFYITSGSVVDASFYIKIKQGDISTSFAPFVSTKSHKLKKVYGSVDGRAKLIYLE